MTVDNEKGSIFHIRGFQDSTQWFGLQAKKFVTHMGLPGEEILLILVEEEKNGSDVSVIEENLGAFGIRRMAGA